MNAETIYEVLKKLIGNVHPIQETNHDNEAHDNQEILFSVMDTCLDEIVENAQRSDDYAYSVWRIKKRAIEYLELVLDYVSGALDGNSESADNDGLKNCPCCGGKAHYHIHDRIGVECNDCGLGLACIYETKEQAAEVWNKRQ